MTPTNLSMMRRKLLWSGVTPKYAERAVAELETHYSELVERAQAAGLSKMEAEQQSADRLGDLDEFAACYMDRTELLRFSIRHPHTIFMTVVAFMTFSMWASIAIAEYIRYIPVNSIAVTPRSAIPFSSQPKEVHHENVEPLRRSD
jgi:hypothetical protein